MAAHGKIQLKEAINFNENREEEVVGEGKGPKRRGMTQEAQGRHGAAVPLVCFHQAHFVVLDEIRRYS